jgi:hypothetical protein
MPALPRFGSTPSGLGIELFDRNLQLAGDARAE